MAAYNVMQERFSIIYNLYVKKVERKQHTKDEVNQILQWLTGYDLDQIVNHINSNSTLEDFLSQMPGLNPNSNKITGSICNVKIEEITDPLTKRMRYMDKLIDEIAKGKAIDKILRK